MNHGLMHYSLGLHSPQSIWPLDWFSYFAKLTAVSERLMDRQTDTQTDGPRYSVCNNRLHLQT